MDIAVIPARGGSKRIPRKNIKEFAGRPMLAHAIEAARDCGLFAKIVVSTDDDEIGAIARDWGALTPFARPDGLAGDHTPTVPVITHAITACEELGWTVDRVCCIYPCVPFLQAGDLVSALQLLMESRSDYSFPVAEFPSAIQRALKRGEQGQLWPFHPGYELVRTQDLEPAYFDAGQFYWGRKDAWMRNDRIHSSGVGLVIPAWRVVDVDTMEDWVRAEMLVQSVLGSGAVRM